MTMHNFGNLKYSRNFLAHFYATICVTLFRSKVVQYSRRHLTLGQADLIRITK